MKTTIEINVLPFEIPSTACIELPACSRALPAAPQNYQPELEAVPTSPQYTLLPLSALTPEQLETLCGDFREAVFERAGKRPRPKAVAAISVRDGHDFEPLREAISYLLKETDDGRELDPHHPADATAIAVLREYTK